MIWNAFIFYFHLIGPTRLAIFRNIKFDHNNDELFVFKKNNKELIFSGDFEYQYQRYKFG